MISYSWLHQVFLSSGCFEGTVMVWGWERVSAAWVGVPQKVWEMSGNFTLPGHPVFGAGAWSSLAVL